eukprot:378855_1
MSTHTLVQIPFEESYEEKSSEYKDDDDIIFAEDDDNQSSSSETFIHHNINDKTTKKNIDSPNVKSLSKVLSPSSLKHDVIRIVSLKECEILKTNINNILQENNYDILYKFNLSQFIPLFKKLFRSSDDNETIKIFNLFSTKEQLSFDYIINNESNFQQLLDSMGCIIDYPREARESICHSRSQTLNVKSHYINNKNYMEYIEYQREIIDQFRTEINDIYKPMILHNKDMEIKLMTLNEENITLSQEIELLEKEILNSNNSSETDVNINMNELHELYNRRLSQSNLSNMYVEIQESHTFLENEILELHNNLKITKNETDKTMDENYKLVEINNKYILLNNKLTNKYNKINKQLNEIKTKLNSKNDEINTFKYEIFSKEQTIQTLNNLYNDTLLQLQFYQKNKNRKKLTRNSFELKIQSIPSMTSHNTYSYNSYQNRSHNNNNHSQFDIFNDLLLQSPNNYTTPNNHSTPITPIDEGNSNLYQL